MGVVGRSLIQSGEVSPCSCFVPVMRTNKLERQPKLMWTPIALGIFKETWKLLVCFCSLCPSPCSSSCVECSCIFGQQLPCATTRKKVKRTTDFHPEVLELLSQCQHWALLQGSLFEKSPCGDAVNIKWRSYVDRWMDKSELWEIHEHILTG